MRSVVIGLRLCGIALEPFWPGAERLLDLAHLGALEVADLGGEALEPGAGQRDRLQQLGVAVARDDLGRDRLARAGRAASSTRALEVRAESPRRCRRRRRSRRPRPAANARSSRSALRCASNAKPASLSAERRRLGVHAVRAPDAERVGVLARALGERRGQLARAGQDDLARARAAAARARCRARRRTSGRSGSSARAGPAEAASTSTNAATSWSVTCSRSCDGLDGERRARGSPRGPPSVGPVAAPRRRRPRPRARPPCGPRRSRRRPMLGRGCSARSRGRGCAPPGSRGVARRCRARRRRPARPAASGRSTAARRARPRPMCATSAARRSPAGRCAPRRRPAAPRDSPAPAMITLSPRMLRVAA